jgi:hypothetical protein
MFHTKGRAWLHDPGLEVSFGCKLTCALLLISLGRGVVHVLDSLRVDTWQCPAGGSRGI